MVALVEDAESVPNNKVTVTAPIKQWHAFALNRRNKKGDRDKALQVIQQVSYYFSEELAWLSVVG